MQRPDPPASAAAAWAAKQIEEFDTNETQLFYESTNLSETEVSALADVVAEYEGLEMLEKDGTISITKDGDEQLLAKAEKQAWLTLEDNEKNWKMNYQTNFQTAKPATSRLNRLALLAIVLVLSLDGNAMMVDAHNTTMNGTLQGNGVEATAAVMTAPLPFAGAQARRGLQETGYAMTDGAINPAVNECKTESETFDCPNSQATYGAIGTWDTGSVTIMAYSTSTCSPSSPPFFARSCDHGPPSCVREGMGGERLWCTLADMSVGAYVPVVCVGSALPHGSV